MKTLTQLNDTFEENRRNTNICIKSKSRLSMDVFINKMINYNKQLYASIFLK